MNQNIVCGQVVFQGKLVDSRLYVDLKLVAQLSTYNVGKKHKTKHNLKEIRRKETLQWK